MRGFNSRVHSKKISLFCNRRNCSVCIHKVVALLFNVSNLSCNALLLLLAFNLANMINLNRQLKAAAASADRANQAKTDFLSTNFL